MPFGMESYGMQIKTIHYKVGPTSNAIGLTEEKLEGLHY